MEYLLLFLLFILCCCGGLWYLVTAYMLYQGLILLRSIYKHTVEKKEQTNG